MGVVSVVGGKERMANVGFEPTPFQTSALNWRLRPLGQLTIREVSSQNNTNIQPGRQRTYRTRPHTDEAEFLKFG